MGKDLPRVSVIYDSLRSGHYNVKDVAKFLREKGYSILTTPVQGLAETEICMTVPIEEGKTATIRFGDNPYNPLTGYGDFFRNYAEKQPQTLDGLIALLPTEERSRYKLHFTIGE